MALADLITSLRLLAQDGPDAKVIFRETLGTDPGMPVDGVNKNFQLRNIPVVAGSVYYSIVGTGAVFRSQAGIALTDAVNGVIVFTVAPNPGAAQGNGVYVDYNYQWFSDAKYTEFINEASQNLLLDASPVTPANVPVGLQPAMLQYALALFFTARSAQYALLYSSGGGMASQSIDSVTKTYHELAESAKKTGDAYRDAYYKKQGRQLTPAYATPAAHPSPGIDPITPPR